jgi:hypothetical protein
MEDSQWLKLAVSPSNFEVAHNLHIPLPKDQKGSKNEEYTGISMHRPNK